MKDILIITNFTSTFSFSDNDRFLYLAKMLKGIAEVEIVTSDFCHEKKIHRYQTEHKWPFRITFLHETGYSRNISLQRFFSHYIWGKNVKRYLARRKKPDLIYCAVPSLSGPYQASAYCRKSGVKFIVDVQDLWPEAFRMVFDIPVISQVLYAPFNFLVNAIYSRADEIVAVSDTYAARALTVNKKGAKGYSVYLGTELREFDANASMDSGLKKNENEVWLGYCGTLGRSYDIPCVIKALSIIKDAGITVPEFIIMGDGPEKESFEAYAASLDVPARFLGRIPYDRVCAILRQCDILVNPIVKGSAGSIINKHADYAASGRAVLNTQESSEYRALVEQYQMGFNCRCEDPKDLSKRLMELLADIELRERMGRNARDCAEKCFDRKKTYLQIQNLIENISES